MRKNTLIPFIISSSILIGVVYALLFYRNSVVGIGFFFFYILLVFLIFLLRFIKFNSFKLTQFDLIFFLLLLLSLVPSFTQNKVIVFSSIFFTIIGLHLVTIYSLWELKIKDFNFLNIILVFFTHFFAQFINLEYIFNFNRQKEIKLNVNIGEKARKIILRIFLGLIIALPILLIYLVIFLSSDDLFSKAFSNLFQYQIFKFISLDNIGFLLCVGVAIITSILLFSGYLLFDKQKQRFKILDFNVKTDGTILMTIVAVINLLFFTFIITQFIYLFGDKQTTIDLGIVYSEYARRGFFEMLIIGVLSTLIIFAIKTLLSNYNKRLSLLLNFSLIINAVFNIIILFSAIKRLSLYTGSYGLSEERFYVYAIILFFMVIFILFFIILLGDIFKLLTSENPKSLIRFAAFILFNLSIIFVLIFGFINPDLIIAKINIDRFILKYNINNTDSLDQDLGSDNIDIDYLIKLSSDSYSQLLNVKEIKLSKAQMCSIASKWIKEEEDRNNFSNFNIYRYFNKNNIEYNLKEYINGNHLKVYACTGYIRINKPYYN